jgi:hypothetical protein
MDLILFLILNNQLNNQFISWCHYARVQSFLQSIPIHQYLFDVRIKKASIGLSYIKNLSTVFSNIPNEYKIIILIT